MCCWVSVFWAVLVRRTLPLVARRCPLQDSAKHVLASLHASNMHFAPGTLRECNNQPLYRHTRWQSRATSFIFHLRAHELPTAVELVFAAQDSSTLDMLSEVPKLILVASNDASLAVLSR